MRVYLAAAALISLAISGNVLAQSAGFEISGPVVVAHENGAVMNEPHWVPPVYYVTPITSLPSSNGVYETDFGALTLDGPNGTEFSVTGGAIFSSSSRLFVRFQPDQRITGEGNNPLYEHQSELDIDAVANNGNFPIFDANGGGASFPLTGVSFSAPNGDTYTFEAGSALTVAPEPASLAMLVVTGTTLSLFRRRRS